jgi:hypothetical protein
LEEIVFHDIEVVCGDYPMSYIPKISFCGGGCESVGSIAQSQKPSSSCENTTGGAESVGSIGQSPTISTTQKSFSFKGDYFESSETSKKDNHTGLKVAGGLVAATAAAIIGLGYLHKSGKLSKVTNEKLKTCIETLKIEDAAKKCHELCGSVKTKVTEFVNSLKK